MPNSPASPGNTTNSASPEKICCSALTTSTWIVFAIFTFLLQRLRLLECFLDCSNHVEGLLGQAIAFAIDDHLETLDGVLERYVLARRTGEVLRHGERLRQEALDLARPRDHQFVFGRKLVHAEDGDDVSQFFVALQGRLHLARGAVVLVANGIRVDLARGGV